MHRTLSLGLPAYALGEHKSACGPTCIVCSWQGSTVHAIIGHASPPVSIHGQAWSLKTLAPNWTFVCPGRPVYVAVALRPGQGHALHGCSEPPGTFLRARASSGSSWLVAGAAGVSLLIPYSVNCDMGSLGRMLQIDLPRDWANLALHRDVWRGVVSRC